MSVGERVHGRTAAGVPRWAVWAAYAVTAMVLPSGLWRIAMVVFGAPLLDGIRPEPGSGVYVVTLSVISEGVAFLTIGLVAEWGERVPRWVPVLGGRRVPTAAAVIPAGLGAVLLTLLWSNTLIMLALGRDITGTAATGIVTHGWKTVAFVIAYVPLAAWGPLLGAVTLQYYRRRRGAAMGGSGDGHRSADRRGTRVALAGQRHQAGGVLRGDARCGGGA